MKVTFKKNTEVAILQQPQSPTHRNSKIVRIFRCIQLKDPDESMPSRFGCTRQPNYLLRWGR